MARPQHFAFTVAPPNAGEYSEGRLKHAMRRTIWSQTPSPLNAKLVQPARSATSIDSFHTALFERSSNTWRNRNFAEIAINDARMFR